MDPDKEAESQEGLEGEWAGDQQEWAWWAVGLTALTILFIGTLLASGVIWLVIKIWISIIGMVN